VLEHDRLVHADLRQPADDLLASAAADTNQSGSTNIVSDARGHQRLIEDFIEAVRSGREPKCSGREGRRSVVLAAAIYEASRTGGWVEIKDEERGTKDE
jgi:predicted dehydrogenase